MKWLKMNKETSCDLQTLANIGEFALLNKIIIPSVAKNNVVSPLGDDCAFVSLPSGNHELVVTTDVAPRPLAWHLGHISYRTWGWYAIVVNVSDLASAGADPLVITTSIEAPGSMSVEDIKEFFIGMAEAAREHNITNAGGNIRESSQFACHGTAIGTVPINSRIRRNGSQPGDIIVAIGNCCQFPIAYIKGRKCGFDELSIDEKDSLTRPRANIKEMQILRNNGLVNAASDNSDGILGAIWNIAEASGCSIELDMSLKNIPEIIIKTAYEHGYNPWNVFYFWGDWQVIVSVPQSNTAEFWCVIEKNHISAYSLGHFCEGPPQLFGNVEGTKKNIYLARNESFVKDSFNNDTLRHVEFMLRRPLWT